MGRAWHGARPQRSQPALPGPALATGGLRHATQEPGAPKTSPRSQSAQRWAGKKRQTDRKLDGETQKSGRRGGSDITERAVAHAPMGRTEKKKKAGAPLASATARDEVGRVTAASGKL